MTTIRRAVSKIPPAIPKDGTFRQINIYECSNKHKTVTRDIHKGTTPFMIRCPYQGCDEFANSRFYDVDQNLEPSCEFFAPNASQLRNYIRRFPAEARQALVEHVALGGLLLRDID